MTDIIVIGAGPAGLTAALYARRQNKNVTVFEKNSFGGQTVFSPKIENYPGFTEMSGMEFSDKLVDQVLYQGADLQMEEVLEVKKAEDGFTVVTDGGEYGAKAVIIATGARHRMLGLEREEDFVGNGISFCAVCDGAFYKDKEVAVIGGGNSALQEAILLSQSCAKVHIIQNLPTLTGEEKLVSILAEKPNVDYTFDTIVDAIIGDDEFKGIRLHNTKTDTYSDLYSDGMFVAIGLIPDNDFVKDVITLNKQGYVDANETCLTSTEGIFVAGDCRTKSIRQIATAISDGAVAALSACKYIEK